jgi:hypothetical protein
MKNKLTKLGVSALCGSLAAVVSAQAGEMTVSGSTTATWLKGSQSTNGNPIGINTGLTFAGSGELDGGQTFSYGVTHADKAAYSVGSIALTTNSLGTFTVGHATGGLGIGGYDDKMPTAWEETWGTGITTSVNLQKGVGSSSTVQWATPTMLGTSLKIAYSPKNDGATSNDKATSGAANSKVGSGIDVVLDMNVAGVNIWAGGSQTDHYSQVDAPLKPREDHKEAIAGASLSLGPITLGYGKSGEWTGSQTASEVEYYDNTMWGVSFNVSDDLSVSYGSFESDKRMVNTSGATALHTIMESTSLQVAYSMGGTAIKIAKTECDNCGYATTTLAQKEALTIALSLAF